MRKLLLMSTCLLSWTAMPLHAQTQPDAGTAPSQEVRPPAQAPSQQRMQPKAAPGEGGAGRARSTEQGQAEPERSNGQDSTAPRNEAPKTRDVAQPDDAATNGQRSPQTPKAKTDGGSDDQRQQTGESPRKRQTGEGEAAGKSRSGEAAKTAPDSAKTQGDAESDRTKRQNAESPAKGGAQTATEPNRTQNGTRSEGANSETGNATASSGAARAEGKLRLDERQANDFHSRIVDRYRGESTHVDVDLSIGVAIPAAVRLRPVPTEIVSEYPEFRDYDFFVEDDEVVIVEPRTREVVEIVGSGGGRRVAGGPAGGPRLGRERIEEITRVIASDRASLAEGGRGPMLRAPANAVIRPLPDRIASTMPDAAAYGYFVDREGRVVVVDRSSREVLDLVE